MIQENKQGKSVKREISAGIIVYRTTEEGVKFLILYHGHSYWNFPKGKIEHEEESLEAAIRETREETGILQKDMRINSAFRAHERFYFRRSGEQIYKIVIFYLAETHSDAVTISHEHSGYGWFSFEEAKRILGKYRDSQRVLKQAYEFLRGKRAPKPSSGGNQGNARNNRNGKNIPRKGPRVYQSGTAWQGNHVRRYRAGNRPSESGASSGQRA